jgi:ectoine hydroxylase-related dioxygenase (phytanoyl-CoA dioxygenase family)
MGNLAASSESAHPPDLLQKVEADGFAIVPSCLDDETVGRLGSHLSNTSYGMRNLLAVPLVRELAASASVRILAETVIGKNCFAVKGTFFNKTQESNWKVAWHQDLTIMVQRRHEVDGFGPWTIKAGIPHVQPPAEILSHIVAIRLHLDESGPDNGPLRVIPGSHREGRLSSEEIAKWQKGNSVVCPVPRGGALLIRPLLLHASSACVVSNPRRVIHLEFSADELPDGLQWYDRV